MSLNSNFDKPQILSEEEISELQSVIKEHGVTQLMENITDFAGSNFKKIIRLSHDIAVAVSIQGKRISDERGPSDKAQFKNEWDLLKELREKGFPALQTHGKVFHIGGGKCAMLLDWIADAVLIDGKFPNNINTTLPAIALAVNMPYKDQEAMADRRSAFIKQLKIDTISPETMAAIQQRTQNLLDSLNLIHRKMIEDQIVVNDFQLLVDKQGRATIIDPLTIYDVVQNKGNDAILGLEVPFYFRDRATRRPVKGEAATLVSDSNRMIVHAVKWCESIVGAKTPTELHKAIQRPAWPTEYGHRLREDEQPSMVGEKRMRNPSDPFKSKTRRIK